MSSGNVAPSELPTFPPKGKSAYSARPLDSSKSWPLIDRVALWLCWGAAILLCLIAGAIVVYMLVRGIQYVRFDLLVSHPQAELDQSRAGGFLDPLLGTFLLTVMGTALAIVPGVATAVWLSEYARPFWLARAVESAVEVVAGTPSIVLAIFGLILFSQQLFSALSFTAEGGAVFGRSFFAASAMMALIALPLIVGGTREALQAIPRHVREASYALGKTKAATIRRVLLPAARPGIATGTALGMGRIAGDTAIVVILLGASLQLTGAGGVEPLDTLRGTGSTLTSYVFVNSPAGEGNAPEKAYAAAFVLLTIVVALNFCVDLIARRRSAPSWNA
jgi:phosphate transport system permease protein